MKDNRRDDRFYCHIPVELRWISGELITCRAMAECIEISKRGMKIVAPAPITARTLVKFSLAGANLRGTATVRHSRAIGLKYLLGVEFMPNARWDPAERPIAGMDRR